MISRLLLVLIAAAQVTVAQVRVPVEGASIYTREVGRGQPIVVLHGGPDFDHSYLLPDLDRLGDRFRMIYYDQRGRGQSAEGVRPGDVTLASEIDDLARVLRHYRLAAPVLLGHSWGAVLALEYATRHPTGVSHLILMNAAPVSTSDVALLRKTFAVKYGSDLNRQREIMATDAYQQGDPETVTARYRLHFKSALQRPEHYERVMAAMRAAFIRQGKEGIVKARAVEDRLMRETWQMDGYDLLPALGALKIPTLVIHGENDFIPIEIAERIARAIPESRFVRLADCGHFAYLERPDDVRRAIGDFLEPSK